VLLFSIAIKAGSSESFWSIPQSISSINCSIGGNDFDYGGDDDDVIIGGAVNDSVKGEIRHDLAAGRKCCFFLFPYALQNSMYAHSLIPFFVSFFSCVIQRIPTKPDAVSCRILLLIGICFVCESQLTQI